MLNHNRKMFRTNPSLPIRVPRISVELYFVNKSAGFAEVNLAQLKHSSRNQILRVKVAQFNMLGPFAGTTASRHALSSSRISVRNSVHFAGELSFQYDVLHKQCFIDALTNSIQFSFTTRQCNSL